MSSTNSSATNNTDKAISLVEDAAVAEDGAADQLTISSLDSSSMAGSTVGSATDTEGEDEKLAGQSETDQKRDGSRRGSQLSLEEDEGLEEAPEAEEEILGGAEARGRAISQLVLFSCVLLTVPLTLMYLSYRFIFIGHYHFTHDRAILYSGIVAAAAVYVILALFAWLAYRDENKLAQQVNVAQTTDERTKKTE